MKSDETHTMNTISSGLCLTESDHDNLRIKLVCFVSIDPVLFLFGEETMSMVTSGRPEHVAPPELVCLSLILLSFSCSVSATHSLSCVFCLALYSPFFFLQLPVFPTVLQL